MKNLVYLLPCIMIMVGCSATKSLKLLANESEYLSEIVVNVNEDLVAIGGLHGTLDLMDISKTLRPTPKYSQTFEAGIADIAAEYPIIVLLDKAGWLFFLDISRTDNVKQLSTLDLKVSLLGHPNSLFMNGDTLYVYIVYDLWTEMGTKSELIVLDISVPAGPVITDTFQNIGKPIGTLGSYIYTANYENNDQFSEVINIYLDNDLETLIFKYQNEYIDFVKEAVFDGTQAFLITESRLVVLDLSDPKMPIVSDTLNLHLPSKIFIQKETTYVAGLWGEISVVKIDQAGDIKVEQSLYVDEASQIKGILPSLNTLIIFDSMQGILVYEFLIP